MQLFPVWRTGSSLGIRDGINRINVPSAVEIQTTSWPWLRAAESCGFRDRLLDIHRWHFMGNQIPDDYKNSYKPWFDTNLWHFIWYNSYGCFLKWWYPTTIGFPTKNDHFGGVLGVPPFKETSIYYRVFSGILDWPLKVLRSTNTSAVRWCQLRPGQTSNKDCICVFLRMIPLMEVHHLGCLNKRPCK